MSAPTTPTFDFFKTKLPDPEYEAPSPKPKLALPVTHQVILGPYKAIYTPRNDTNKNTPCLVIYMGTINVFVFTSSDPIETRARPLEQKWSDTKKVHAYNPVTQHNTPVPEWLFEHRDEIERVFVT